ncbi:MAG: nitroreductase family protein [Desulfobacterales bacterium]|nr:MAG: nitroreductase family protein [Desulfobacterales bacterium]
MIVDLIKQNRSCRRFYQDHPVDQEMLKSLVNLGRISASGAHLQPLKYIISCDPDQNANIFSCLAWAGYLKDWKGPQAGEQPSAYIIMLCDTEISKDPGCDHGIASQSILLGAREKGLGGCMIATINKEALREHLNIPKQYKIVFVLAIGKPKEEAVLETVGADGNIRYWRDEQGVHHVPKRSLEDIIIGEYKC